MRLEDIYKIEEASMADPIDRGNPIKSDGVDQATRKRSNIKAPTPELKPVDIKGKNVKHSAKAVPPADKDNPRPAIKHTTRKLVLKKKDERKLVKNVRKNADR